MADEQAQQGGSTTLHQGVGGAGGGHAARRARDAVAAHQRVVRGGVQRVHLGEGV